MTDNTNNRCFLLQRPGVQLAKVNYLISGAAETLGVVEKGTCYVICYLKTGRKKKCGVFLF